MNVPLSPAGGAGGSLPDIAAVAASLKAAAHDKARRIQQITGQVKMLALNAKIESSRAGEFGGRVHGGGQRGRHRRRAHRRARPRARGRRHRRIDDLQDQVARMAERAQGDRLVDLALNAIELIDRNLYERTCDVRWWATDSAVVECAAAPAEERAAHASRRLGVILSAYTVYLDLWLCDLDGRVLAHGRPERFAGVRGGSVAHEPWFRKAAGAGLGRRLRRGRHPARGAPRRRPGGDLLRQRPGGRRGVGRAPRRPGDPFRLGAAGPGDRPGGCGSRPRIAAAPRVLLLETPPSG